MSEYKTLEEWMGGKTRSEGLRLTPAGWDNSWFFEPIYEALSGYWHGLDQDNCACHFIPSDMMKLYVSPKKTKKVTLYKPVRRWYFEDSYLCSAVDGWCSDKEKFTKEKDTIVGWATMEVEVEE